MDEAARWRAKALAQLRDEASVIRRAGLTQVGNAAMGGGRNPEQLCAGGDVTQLLALYILCYLLRTPYKL